MADETLRFDIVGEDNLSEPLNRAGSSAEGLSRHMDAAARSAKILDDALKRQNIASRVSVDATLALARADKILEDAEHGLRDGALEAEFALKKQAEAAKKSGDAADKAAAQNKGLQASLQKLADSAKGGGGPGWLGPALGLLPAAATLGGVAGGAAIGLGGAAVAGGGALAAFAAVAKPVLADTLKAAQAVNAAQNTYQTTIAAGVPTAQAQLSLQTANAKAVLTYNAAIAGGANPAKALAAEHLALAKNQLTYNAATNAGVYNAKAYRAEQLAIAKAYAELSPQQIALSKQLGAMAQAWQDLKAAQTPVVAGALQPWLKAVTDLTKNLGPIIAAVSPRIRDLGFNFDALINSPQFKVFRDFITNTGASAVSAAGGTLIDFIDAFIILLPKFNPLIEKTIGWIGGLGPAVLKWASSKKTADDITKFMAWFSTNGPVVGDLLKNIGKALANLAPGLTAGGAIELKVISDFFGWVAKLPKGLATPLAETAGALLLLNKLGVFSVGVKLIGMDAAKAAAAGGAAGIWGKLLPGVRLVGAALVIDVIIQQVLKPIGGGPGKPNPFDNPFGGSNPDNPVKGSKPNALSSWDQLGADIANIWNSVWNNTITRTAKGFHDLAGVFDTGRHDIAAHANQITSDIIDVWNKIWNNTIARVAKGFHDTAGLFDTGRHTIAAHMSEILSNVIDAWNKIWNNTIARIQRGFHDTSGLFDTGRHTIAATFAGIRTDVANAWNLLWNNTVTRVQNGIADVVRFFQGLPGKIVTALGNAATTLTGWGKGVINGLLAGMTSVITSVWNFIKSIPGQILKFLGIKSPPDWAIEAGKQIMNGLGIGMTQAQGVFTKASAASAAAAGAAAAGAFAGQGGSNAANIALAKKMAAAAGWTGAEWTALLAIIMQESGGSSTIKNPNSTAAGIAQNIAGFGPGYQYGNAAQQIAWMINYIRGRYGDPIKAEAFHLANNYYAGGGRVRSGTSPTADDVLIRVSRDETVVSAADSARLAPLFSMLGIPGYASGGSVASKGAAYLKGWHKSAGTVNAQIDHWTHAEHIDSILAGAAGLSKTLHARYAKAAADDKKTLAGLTAERTVMRDWRTELSGSDVSLNAWIAAAGKTPQLRANVAGWKKQLASQKETIQDISAMLGLTGAQLAADAAAAKAAAAASAAAAAAVAAASSAAGGAAGAAGAAGTAAATTAAAVPLTPAAALALLTGTGSGTVPLIPPLTGPGEGGGAFPWPGWGGGTGAAPGTGAFPWSGWGGSGGGQGRPGMAGSGGGTGGTGSQDSMLAELRALRAELRQLTGVAASIPRATGQHVGAVVNGAAAQGSFNRRYP